MITARHSASLVLGWFSGLAQVSFVFLLTMAVATASHAKEIAPFNFGNWTGGAYSNDSSGIFSHCAATAGYNSGISLSVFVNRSYAWGIGLIGPSWQMAVGSKISLQLRIDRGPWMAVTAEVILPQAVSISMSSDDAVIYAFRHGRLLQIYDGSRSYFFNLTGTSRLVADLAGCVKYELALEAPPPSPPALQQQPTPANPATPTSTDQKQPTLSSGSGIILTADGDILTNDHVIEGCGQIAVTRADDVAATATVIASDAANDLALLRSTLKVDKNDLAHLRTQPPLPAGSSVAVYGFPLAGTLSSSGNIVSGNVTALAGIGDDVRFFQISAPIQPGNSGGPLLDGAGNVVGVVNSKLNELAWAKATGSLPQTVNFAIKASVAASFLDAHSVSYATSTTENQLSLPAVTAQAKKFTALILCIPEPKK
jgi:S1-C subfamily serine protease